jgi:ACS family hexuronate transporter-like MFS transporter
MGFYYRWVILGVFLVSQTLLSIAGYGWAALAPFLKTEMLLRDSQIGAISSIYYFAAASSALPAGIAVDRFGVKICLSMWLALTGVPLLVVSVLHHDYVTLILSCAVSGLGYGMGNPVAAKGLYSWFDPRLRATAFGIRQSAVTIGAAVSGMFLVTISQKAGPFVALRTTGLMIMGMIPMALFLYHHPERENTPATQLFAKGGYHLLLRNGPFFLVSSIMALLGLSQGAIVTFFVLYLKEELGIALFAAGSFFSLLMVSATCGRIVWGVISDRFFKARRVPVLMIISILTALCEVILALWSITWPVRWMLLMAVTVGISSISWNSIGLVLVTELCSSSQTAGAVGLASTLGWTGIFFGPLCFGILLDIFGYGVAWLSMAFCGFVALILCFFLQRPEKLCQRHE